MNISPELLAQLREALEIGRDCAWAERHEKAIYAALAALNKLEAQPDTDAADARRYRWLRDKTEGISSEWWVMRADEFDAAIDAAMKEEKE